MKKKEIPGQSPMSHKIPSKRSSTSAPLSTRISMEEAQRYRSFFENALVGFYQTTPDGRFLSANAALAHILGFECVEDLLKVPVTQFYPTASDRAPRLQELNSNREVQGVYQLQRRDGQRIWVRDVARVVRDGDDRVLCYEGMLTDVTERKQMVDALQLSHRKFEELVNSVEGIVWEADVKTFQFVFVSKQAERILGYPLSRWLDEPTFWADHIHPQDKWVVEFCRKKTRAKENHRFEYRFMAADGGTVWLSDFVTVVTENGEATRLRGVMLDITQLKQAEESELKLMLAVEHSDEVVIMTDTHGVITYVNPAFQKVYGYTRAEAIGQTPRLLKSGLLSASYYEEFWKTLLSGKSIRGEIINKGKDGQLLTMEVSVNPVFGAHGAIIGFIAIQEDVTERKMVEAAESQQRVMAEALRDTAGALNSTLNFEEVLDRILENVGRVVPHDAANIMLLEEDTQLVRIVKARGYALQKTEAWISSLQVRLSDFKNVLKMYTTGRPHWIMDTQDDPHWVRLPEAEWVRSNLGAPIRSKGRVIGFVLLDSRTPRFFNATHASHLQAFADQAAIAIENARLFEAEHAAHVHAEALREVASTLNENLEQEQLLHLVLEQLERVIRFDSATIMLVNDKTAQIVAERGREFDREELKSLQLDRLEHIREVLQSQRPLIIPDTHSDPRWQRLGGSADLRSWLGVPLVVKGQSVGLLNLDKIEPNFFTSCDAELAITFANQAAIALENARLFHEIQLELAERKRAEEALRLSEEKYRTLAESAQDDIFIVNRDDRLEYVNSSAAAKLGLTQKDVIGKPRSIFFPEDVSTLQRQQLQKILETGVSTSTVDRLSFLGAEAWLHTRLTPLRNQDGQIYAVLGISRDITERKQLEEQLLQSQKMEAVGRLAGGVAHDFNNLLTAINGYSELVLNRLTHGDPLRKDIEEIKRAGERAAALTRQLLAFSRKQVLMPRVLDLNQVVTDLEKMLRRLIGEDIQLTTQLDPHLGHVKADPGQIEQVLMNLVLNSRDAMPHGGELVISTANVEADKAFSVIAPG